MEFVLRQTFFDWHIPELLPTARRQLVADTVAPRTPEQGTKKIRDMIVDDIRASHAHNDKEHVLTLVHVLHRFLRTHPEVRDPNSIFARQPVTGHHGCNVRAVR
jgi:hypothetical protein